MHGPFSDLNASPQSESVMMAVLQNGGMKLLTCQTEFFAPSDSFIFPSYLHTLPSFILTVKSLNL